MASVEKVLIVGAGIGGLGSAALFGQQGIEVEMVEIKPEAKVYGVGINQPGNSLRALREIGVLPEILAVGYQFDRWIFHDYRGEVIVDVPSQLGGDGIPPNCALSRRALQNILIEAADSAGATVRYGTTVADLNEVEGRVDVNFSDGSEGSYDLVLGFDGIKSPLRRRLFGEANEPVYTGYGVWRVTVPRPEHITYGAVYQSPRHKAGHIPLSEETMYLFLVTPEPEGAHYDPADFRTLLSERLEEFEGVVGDIRDNLTDDDDIVFGPLSEVLLSAPWHRGRVAIGGDATHACTPHITQGAGMALEDAVVLADELGGELPIEQALANYAERRYPRAKFVQDVSRGILQAEMSITEETLAVAIEHMAAELPGQFAGVDAFLNQPA
jgi:2-polyprenyl-6-methoxyphenol hydroxylase-like FAD-dependent oxidoreductase